MGAGEGSQIKKRNAAAFLPLFGSFPASHLHHGSIRRCYSTCQCPGRLSPFTLVSSQRQRGSRRAPELGLGQAAKAESSRRTCRVDPNCSEAMDSLPHSSCGLCPACLHFGVIWPRARRHLANAFLDSPIFLLGIYTLFLSPLCSDAFKPPFTH